LVDDANDPREQRNTGAHKTGRVSLFITGTDTGVGKTHTTIQLLRLLRASGTPCAGMKPICCGDRRDAELLLAAGSGGVRIEEINPVWLKTPAAPLVGSLTEGVNIDIERILAVFRRLAGADSSKLFCQRFGRRDGPTRACRGAESPGVS